MRAVRAVLLAAAVGASGCSDHVRLTEPARGGLNGPEFAVIVHDFSILPTLGGDRAEAYGLNQHGLVVGASETGSSAFLATMWENGAIYNLGLLASTGSSAAFAVNASRQVAGRSTNANDQNEAVLWANGQVTGLGLFGQSNSIARAINDQGLVVGEAGSNAFYWQNGAGGLLAGFPGMSTSAARAVNNGGRIAGESTPEGSAYSRAVVWDNQVMQVLEPDLDGFYAFVEDMNERGEVVGYVRDNAANTNRSVWWRDSDPEYLDVTIPSGVVAIVDHRARGINNLGQVVGSVQTSAGPRAYLWMDGESYLLPAGVSQRTIARRINDHGVVVGSGNVGFDEEPVVWQVPIRAEVAVEPGSGVVKSNGGGKVTVVVYGSPWFNASQLDAGSFTLGDESGTDTPVIRNNRGRVDARLTDYNKNGHQDLVLSFDRRQLVANGDLQAGMSRMILLGRRSDGKPVRGVGLVTVTP